MLDILFVQNYYEQMLGIMHISSILKKNGYKTDVVMGSGSDILRKVVKTRPRVAGFYCTTGFHHKNLLVASRLKRILKDDTLTLFGGPHPTFVPGMIGSDGVDMLCQGEGEYAVLDLLKALDEKRDYTKIKNLIVKKDGELYRNEIRPLCNLEEIPFPDREIYAKISFIYKNKKQEVMISRGCVFNCAYCSSQAYKELYSGKGNYVRLRPIPNVIEELEIIKTQYKPTSIFFHDDVFIFKKDYCLNLLEVYKKKIGIPFACLIRADLMTEDLAMALKDSGCYFVYFGIESGNEGLRSRVLQRNIRDSQILDCARILHKHRLIFSTFNMVGLPEESLADTWSTVDLNIKIKPGYAWFSVYQPLPKTRLSQYALDEGILEKIDVGISDATFHERSALINKNPEGRKMLRLKNTANLMLRLPFARPVIKNIALKVPIDPVYNLLDKFLYLIFYYFRLTYKLNFLGQAKSALFLLVHLRKLK